MAIRRNLSQPLAVSAFDGPDKPKVHKYSETSKTKKKIVRGGKKKKEVKEFDYRTETDDARPKIGSVEGTVKKKYDRFGKLKKKVTKTKTAPIGTVSKSGTLYHLDPKEKKRRTVKKKTKVKYN